MYHLWTKTKHSLIETTILFVVVLVFAFGLKVAQPNEALAATGINQQLNYQGKLMSSAGAQVSDGNWNFRFRIYSASSGGTLLWTERWTSTTTRVATVNGVFSAALGTIGGFSTSSIDWSQDNLYLQIDMDADNNGSWEESFATRKRLTSSPYAFNADTVDGFHATSTAAVASYLMALDANKVLNLYDGGVSSTRATTTQFVYIAPSAEAGSVDHLDRSGGDLYVADDIEFDSELFGNIGRLSVLNATTTNIGSLLVYGSATTTGNLTVNGVASSTLGLFTQGGLHIGGAATFDGLLSGLGWTTSWDTRYNATTTLSGFTPGNYLLGSAYYSTTTWAGGNNNLNITGYASSTLGLFTQSDLHVGGASTFDGLLSGLGWTTSQQNWWNATTTWAGSQSEFNKYLNATTTLDLNTLSLGTALGVTSGGTGLSSIATGQLIYGSTPNVFSALNTPASANLVLRSSAADTFAWGALVDADIPDTITVSNYLLNSAYYATTTWAGGNNNLNVTGYASSTAGLFTQGNGHYGGTLTVDGNITADGNVTVSNVTGGALILSNGLTAAPVNNATPQIYRSGTNAGSYPFNTFGHLVYQPRTTASFDHVFMGFQDTSNTVPRMVIQGSGNVGIGITTPTSTLSVAGNVDFRGNATTTGWFNIGTTAIGTTLGSLIGAGDLYVGRNATVTTAFNVGTLFNVRDGGGILTGLFTANDFRPSMLNATTTNIGTLTVYTGSTFNGLTTFSDLRATTLNATSTTMGTVTGYGLFNLSDLRTATLNATSTTLGTLTGYGLGTFADFRPSVLNASSTTVGTFTAYSGGTLNGLFTATDFRPSVLNASSTTVGTFTAYSQSNFNALSIFSDLRTSSFNASSTANFFNLFAYGSATTTGTLNVNGYASTTNLVLGPNGANMATLDDVYVSGGNLFFNATQITGGAGIQGMSGAWQSTFGGLALTPTSTTAGFFVNASSTVAANFRVDGNATTTGNLTVDSTTLVVQADTDRVGIGTASPGTLLDVAGNVKIGSAAGSDVNKVLFSYSSFGALGSGSAYGAYLDNRIYPGAQDSSAALTGLYANPWFRWYTTQTQSGLFIGVDGFPYTYLSGDAQVVTVSGNVIGVRGSVGFGTGAGATINANNIMSLYAADATKGTGTITNAYGLYIENITKGTNNYGVYSAGGNNYFGGNVGIGLTSPTSTLSVAGNVDFRGNATTTGWFNIGTTAVGTTLGSLIGAGDLYVGRNATTSGNLTVDDGFAVFNESSGDNDFRVESNNETHMLFIDAGNDVIGIATSTPKINATFTLAGRSGDHPLWATTQSQWGGLNLLTNNDQELFSVYPNDADLGGTILNLSDLGTKKIVLDTDGDTYFNGGNVGIGDTSPLSLFTVGDGDKFRIDASGNATSSGWFNIGTADVVGTLGSKIGAGDLYVGRNATTTGNLTAGGWATSTSGLFTQGNGHYGGTLTVDGSVTASGYLNATNDNLLYNGDFETGNSNGWSNVTAVVSASAFSGKYSAEITGSKQIESVDYIPVDPDYDVLQLEGWFKETTTGATPGVLYFGYIAYDENKVAITTAPCGTYCYFAAAGYNIANDGAWHKFSATTHGEGTSAPNFPVGTKYVRVLMLSNYGASIDEVSRFDHITLKRINYGSLFVGNDFSSTNLIDQTQVTQLYTTAINNFIITPPSGGYVGIGDTTPLSLFTVGSGDKFRIDASGNATSSGWFNIGTTDVIGTLGSKIGAGDLFVGSDATITNNLSIAGDSILFSAANPIIRASSYITLPGGLYVSGGTAYFETEAKFRNGIANDATFAYNGDVAVNDGFRMLSNATTSGWFNIGTTAVGTTLGSKIGAGDLYVGRNATTTGNLTVGGFASTTIALNTQGTLHVGGATTMDGELTVADITSGTDLDFSNIELVNVNGIRVGNTASPAGWGLYMDSLPGYVASYFRVDDYLAASGGVHVGGISDPGTDNLIVDGQIGIGTSATIVADLQVGALPTGASSISAQQPSLLISASSSPDGIARFEFTDSSGLGGIMAFRGTASKNAVSHKDMPQGFLFVTREKNGTEHNMSWGTDGRFAIATNSPDSLLHVYAENSLGTNYFQVGSSTNPEGFLIDSGGIVKITGNIPEIQFADINDDSFYIGAEDDVLEIGTGSKASGTNLLDIESTGEIGIGTNAPASKLHIVDTDEADNVLLVQDSSGLCEAQPTTTGLTWSCSSDARLKYDIKPAENVIDYLTSIPLFDYKVKATDEQVYAGPVAQNLLNSHPELVVEGDDGYLTVSSLPTWKLVKAIQEQQVQINNILNQPVSSSTPALVVKNPDIDIQTLVVQQAATFYGTLYVQGEAGFMHKVVFEKDIEVKGKIYVSADQAGTGIIKAGATSTEIIFINTYEAAPKVTATAKLPVALGIYEVTARGFRVLVADVPNTDLAFDWIALAVRTDGLSASPIIDELITSLTQVSPGIPVELWARVTDEDTPESDLSYTWQLSPRLGTIDGNSGLVYWTVQDVSNLTEDTDVTITVTVSDGINTAKKSTTVRVLKGSVAGASNEDEVSTPPPANPAPVVTPPAEPEPILGCTDQTATNYNANATQNDTSCTYAEPEPELEPPANPAPVVTPPAEPEPEPPPPTNAPEPVDTQATTTQP